MRRFTYFRTVVGVSVAVGVFLAGGWGRAGANPIPWPPPASMPLENMTVAITETTQTLHAAFSGEFTFTYIPTDVAAMLFPVPPGTTGLAVWQGGAPKTWDWSTTQTYPTILPEMPTIPMIEWYGPFPEAGTIFRVDYEHDLIPRAGEEWIFFYANGTGKFFPTYQKTTTANFDIALPPGYGVNGVWWDTISLSYSLVGGHLLVSVQSDFGPIVHDLIVSLQRDARIDGTWMIAR